jgi:hypothetical protein
MASLSLEMKGSAVGVSTLKIETQIFDFQGAFKQH